MWFLSIVTCLLNVGFLCNKFQNEIHERDQRIHHLEQSLEEREQQHRANQMQANEAVSQFYQIQNMTDTLVSLRSYVVRCTFRS